MIDRTAARFDGFLWFLWIMATAWGWILGRIVFPAVLLVAAGIGVAVFQWLVLQRRMSRSWRWAAYTAAGWAAGALLALAAGQFEPSFVSGLLLGTTAGLAQWLVLRREVRWAFWWVPISAVGWSTGLGMALAPLLAGVVAGAVTGIALVLLVHYPLGPRPAGIRGEP
ncbi:MAG TPA: hypothetical protein PKO09_03570 [Anaerolineae bacterium]|nr:hypothetical protein [Anaerolineae bacterium]